MHYYSREYKYGKDGKKIYLNKRHYIGEANSPEEALANQIRKEDYGKNVVTTIEEMPRFEKKKLVKEDWLSRFKI
jgi:hypothetical protein